MKKSICLLCCLLAALCVLAACRPVGDEARPAAGDMAAAQPEPAPLPEPEPEPEPEPVRIRLMAVGDNLLHNTVSNSCKTEEGGFDFAPLYANIAPFAQKADLAFINEEVPLAGEVGAYPMLSAPTDVAAGLKETGFNIVNTATNHSLDKGQDGLLTSLEALKSQGFDAVLGCFATQEEASEPALVEKQGVTFGFLSYTYGTNGIPLPSDKPWMVSLIDEGKMESDMAALRPQCDVLVVSMHWGVEYQTAPSDEQRALAQKLAGWGADIIIGTHPHVLQPVEMLTRPDGGQTLCVYSLGNFVSGQHRLDAMLGGMLWCELVFTPGEEGFAFENVGVMPVVTYYEGGGRAFDIVPLSDYTQEMAENHGVAGYDAPATVEALTELASDVLGGYMLGAGDIL